MPTRNKYPIKFVLGGLIGIDVVFLQSLISQGKLDIPSIYSILFFAVALPMLSFSFLVREQPRATEKMNKSYPSVGVITQIGIIVNLAGITAAFWHSLPWAGLAFLASGIVAFSIYFTVDRDMKKDTPPKDGQLKRGRGINLPRLLLGIINKPAKITAVLHIRSLSSQIVTGPSFSNSTCI